jgi:hypothetical protein
MMILVVKKRRNKDLLEQLAFFFHTKFAIDNRFPFVATVSETEMAH